MKLLFIAFLTLSLVLTGPWPGAYTQTLDSSSEELTEEFEIPTILRFAFLKEMATRTLLFQEMNRERLIHAHECLKAGTCPELLAQIKNNITALFPVYRHYLALVNLVGRSQILLHEYITKRRGTDFLDIPQENPLVAGFKMAEVPTPDYSDAELMLAIQSNKQNLAEAFGVGTASMSIPNDLLEIYNGLMAQSVLAFQEQYPNASCEDVPACAKMLQSFDVQATEYSNGMYTLNLNGFLKLWCDLLYEGSAKVCEGLKAGFYPDQRRIHVTTGMGEQIGPRTAEGLKLRAFALQQLGQFRKATEDYLNQALVRIVSKNPYVALVSSATPDNVEIVRAIGHMAEAAKESTELVAKKVAKAERKGMDEAAMIEFMEYDMVAKSIISDPPKDLFDLAGDFDEDRQAVLAQVNDELMSTYFKKGLVDTAITMGSVIAPGLLCAAPFLGRLKLVRNLKLNFLKTVKNFRLRKFLRTLSPGQVAAACVAGHALAVNTYFLWDAYELYHEAYVTIFGTMQGQELLRDMTQLSQAERGLLIAFVTMPLGVPGTMAIGKRILLNLRGKLRPGSLKYLEESVTRLRQQPAH